MLKKRPDLRAVSTDCNRVKVGSRCPVTYNTIRKDASIAADDDNDDVGFYGE